MEPSIWHNYKDPPEYREKCLRIEMTCCQLTPVKANIYDSVPVTFNQKDIIYYRTILGYSMRTALATSAMVCGLSLEKLLHREALFPFVHIYLSIYLSQPIHIYLSIYPSISFFSFLPFFLLIKLSSLVGWSCTIYRLLLWRGVIPPPTSYLNMILNNLMVKLH